VGCCSLMLIASLEARVVAFTQYSGVVRSG
jgi:hypothetical protein